MRKAVILFMVNLILIVALAYADENAPVDSTEISQNLANHAIEDGVSQKVEQRSR